MMDAPRPPEPAGQPPGGSPSFGALLLEFRLRARLTQEELAARSGISVRTISELERGRRPAPHLVSAHMLAAALGLEEEERSRFFASMRHHRRLRAEVRAAASAAGAAGDLASPDAILGRDGEIAAIARAFAAGDRVVTLLGPGGIGKTRLAREYAAERREHGGRVIWVGLDAIASADLVLPAIARAAGAADPGPGGVGERIVEALGDQPALLVIDNAEHLVAAAPGLAALVAAAPALSVLVTSREALRLSIERPMRVAPLPLPTESNAGDALAANPAVALFLRTLAAAAPDRASEDADPAHAAAIVRMLDGLPLAIELAAAQGATLPLATIAGLLETAGLAALARGRRDGPSRFQTMDAAIAWSADLLPADARRLFQMLGIFRGGFTFPAVVAVAAELGEPHLVSALPTLAESSLIQHEVGSGEGRLRMLEPVRLFARERLRRAGEEPAASRAHAAWYLRWARDQAALVAGPSPGSALDALDDDLANLLAAIDAAPAREALAAAGALSQYWEARARFREGQSALAAALAAATDADLASTAGLDAVFWTGYLAYLQADVPGLAGAISRLAPLALVDGSPEYAARMLILEILRRDAAGLPTADSLTLGQDAHALMADQPREVSWHMATVILANLHAQSGDPEAAVPLLRDYEAWARERNAALHLTSASDWLGFTLLDTGRAGEARRRFAESIGRSSRIGSRGTIYLPLLGYILACSTPDAAPADLECAALLLGALDREIALHGFPLGERNAALLASSRERIAAALGPDRSSALLAEGAGLALEDVPAVAIA